MALLVFIKNSCARKDCFTSWMEADVPIGTSEYIIWRFYTKSRCRSHRTYILSSFSVGMTFPVKKSLRFARAPNLLTSEHIHSVRPDLRVEPDAKVLFEAWNSVSPFGGVRLHVPSHGDLRHSNTMGCTSAGKASFQHSLGHSFEQPISNCQPSSLRGFLLLAPD